MHTEHHTALLVKPAQRQLREKVIEGNLTSLLASVNTKSLKVQGWRVDYLPYGVQMFRQSPDESGEGYVYEISLTVDYEGPQSPDGEMLHRILRTINQRAGLAPYGRWQLASYDGRDYVPPAEGDLVVTNDDLVGYSETTMPDDFEGEFDHLFGLDAHIARIKSALEAGIMSDWSNRFHCALVGPPGCGKSDICRTIKATLGDDAVMEFDATATTAAGAIKELTEREILPRVLIVEEIEKADEKALAFLLAVCDLRGEIRKVTARNTIQRNTKLFVIATVNDVPLFDKLQAGALSSRFANKIWFKRPSRETLALILTREVGKLRDGDVRWIEPTLDYADQHGITDPRQLIALCLCGRDQWLTGEYAALLSDTADPDEVESPI